MDYHPVSSSSRPFDDRDDHDFADEGLRNGRKRGRSGRIEFFVWVLLYCFCLVDCRKEFNLQMLTFCCRSWNFSTAWKNLVKSRWPNLGNQIEPIDWQQMYWETHLQKYAFFFASQWKNRDSIFCSWMICRFSCMIPQTNNSCLDEVAEIASLPSFDGRLGEIGISGTCY